MEIKQRFTSMGTWSRKNSLFRLHKVLLVAILCVSFTSCEKKKDELPDPLAAAAGSFTGNVEENGKVILNIKANVTTATDSYGRLYISSVGFTSSSYQLVVSNANGYVVGQKNGLNYELRVVLMGNILNVSGKYSVALGSANYPQYNFSFTGTKQ